MTNPATKTPNPDPASRGELSFSGHLKELKKRLLYIIFSFLLFFGTALFFRGPLWNIISKPLHDLSRIQLVNITPGEGIQVELKLSLYVALLLVLPVLMYQIKAFVQPAISEHNVLSRKFKGLNLPLLLLSSSILVSLGAAFAFFIILPFLFLFLQTYLPQSIEQQWTQAAYTSFTLNLVLAFALLFQMPLISFLLGRLKLLQAKWMAYRFKWAIILALFVSAFLTPPDAGSMILVAVPITFLYLFSSLCVYFGTQMNGRAEGESKGGLHK